MYKIRIKIQQRNRKVVSRAIALGKWYYHSMQGTSRSGEAFGQQSNINQKTRLQQKFV